MKTILWLIPLAASLAACAPYDPYHGGYPPPPAPYPPQSYPPNSPYPPEPYPPYPPAPPAYPSGETYRAIGTEPFWDLRIGRELVFTDRGMELTVVQPTPRPIIGFAGEIYRTPRIEVNINHANCSDGMSDRTYPDTIHVRVDGRDYRGCGASTEWFESTDERGNPRPPADGDAVPLADTHWRVVAINGRPTPPRGNFSMNFEDRRFGATFGCNGLGASYTQRGAILDADNVVGTQMACPDMSWEQQGAAVLGQRMTIRRLEPNRISLTSSAGSIVLLRR